MPPERPLARASLAAREQLSRYASLERELAAARGAVAEHRCCKGRGGMAYQAELLRALQPSMAAVQEAIQKAGEPLAPSSEGEPFLPFASLRCRLGA